jgi:hypothetical protein
MDYQKLWEQLKVCSLTITNDNVIYPEDLLELMDELELNMMLDCGITKFRDY